MCSCKPAEQGSQGVSRVLCQVCKIVRLSKRNDLRYAGFWNDCVDNLEAEWEALLLRRA